MVATFASEFSVKWQNWCFSGEYQILFYESPMRNMLQKRDKQGFLALLIFSPIQKKSNVKSASFDEDK